MFTDCRSKKVIFISHCLLNQNAISDGTAVFPAAFKDLIEFLLKNDIGIVQMPCPELTCLGLDRGNIEGCNIPVVIENTRIRSEILKKNNYEKLMLLVDYTFSQILEYYNYNFEIIGIIGANRSPNCGVDTTSKDNKEVRGKGIFIEELSKKIKNKNLNIPMIGLKGSDNVLKKLSSILKNY